jgi:hypothetical protein
MEYVVKLGRTIDQTVEVTVNATSYDAAETAALEIARQTVLEWEFHDQLEAAWCVETTQVEEDYRKAAAELVLKGLPTTGSGTTINLPMSTINSWEMSGYMLPPGWQVKQTVSNLLKSIEDNVNQKLRDDFNKAANEATDRFLGRYRVNYEQAKAILETIGEACDDPACWCKDGGKRHLDEEG